MSSFHDEEIYEYFIQKLAVWIKIKKQIKTNKYMRLLQ